jgi:hypothetical protein
MPRIAKATSNPIRDIAENVLKTAEPCRSIATAADNKVLRITGSCQM